MHIRPEPPQITPEAVTEALENEHDRKILAAAQEGPIAAQDLIDATDTPRSTAYRRIERLVELRLLRVASGAIKSGHAIERYRATVEWAALSVSRGEVSASWRLLESAEERLSRLWTQMRG